jgi:hypothetical protein
MERDLGLDDSQISEFLTSVSTRSQKDKRLDLHTKWSPEQDKYNTTPVITHIGEHDGVELVRERLQAIFPQRFAEVQPNIITTPAEDYAQI